MKQKEIDKINKERTDGFKIIKASQPFNNPNHLPGKIDWDKKFRPDWFKVPTTKIVVE
jgi:hypothetical protein